MPAQQLSPEVLKALMSPEQYQAWEKQQQDSRRFWATLGQYRYDPALRPAGSNADHWALFLEEHKDATSYLAVQIAEAIEQAERRGSDIADRLAKAELEYRTAYQQFGAGDTRTGRAWDKMRAAGDAIRGEASD